VKLVSEQAGNVPPACQRWCRQNPDSVAPMEHGCRSTRPIYHAGLPLDRGMAEAQQTLVMNAHALPRGGGGRRQAHGRPVVAVAALGCRGVWFRHHTPYRPWSLMQRDCQKDTCPVGICTQNDTLLGHFAGKPRACDHFFAT
jgi:glutamate synthase (ferredoxin)